MNRESRPGQFVCTILCMLISGGCSGGKSGSAGDASAAIARGGNPPTETASRVPVGRISARYATQYVRPGGTVTLDGRGSYDPDGGALAFEWQILSVPAASTARLADSTTAQTSFVADLVGDYQVQLVVSDGHSHSAPVTTTVVAQMEASAGLNWGIEDEVDTGEDPGVAVNNRGVVVEVHESPITYDLWYRVGVIRGGIVEWGSSHRYDTGIKPSVDINDDGVVVEMHSNELGTALWYHVGIVDVATRTVDFGGARELDSGRRPSVAINNHGTVVEVHSSEICCGLWYHVGQVDLAARRVHFGGSKHYDQGLYPSVDIDDSGLLVEVHESQNYDDLWYWVGQVDATSLSFTKLSHGKYDTGQNADVAINNAGRVVVAHESGNERDITLWSAIGSVSAAGLQLGGAQPYNFGRAPALALNDHDQFLEMHDFGDVSALPTSHILALLTADFPPVKDSARWMELTPTMHRKTLRQILLPGTHDSAAYRLHPYGSAGPVSARGPDWVGIEKACTKIPGWLGEWLIGQCKAVLPGLQPQEENDVAKDLTLAQGRGLGDQLRGGIRYFDLRITIRDQQYRAYHGLLGDPIAPMLDEIRGYMHDVRRELIVIGVSKLDVGTHETNDSRSFTAEEHDGLMTLLVDRLGDYLYQRGDKTYGELLGAQFRHLVRDGPRIVLIYGNDFLTREPLHPLARYFWPKDGFGSGTYKNTISLTEQESDQRQKFNKYLAGENRDTLFQLYQTLTANDEIAVKNVIYDRVLGSGYRPTLHALSQAPNQHLAAFLADGSPKFPNIVLVDFFEESEVVARAIEVSGACTESAITGRVAAIPSRLWPPNHEMVPVLVDVSGLVSANPESFQALITGIEVTEPDRKDGRNIYVPKGFAPDSEITGELTASVRSERDGRAAERVYWIKVTASDCSGDYDFVAPVRVPHDQGN